MAIVDTITIKEAIEKIDRKNYVLPAIQREFVWSTFQIERLFDSLLRDYPISSFLFWEVEEQNINNYQFYEFIRDYHERDKRHNEEANITGNRGIIAILDGQQRLTSLYIGLKGSYTYKISKKRWDNDDAFPKRRLYLNLLQKSENEEFQYEFKFLTGQEAGQIDENHYWFPVGEILKLKEEYEVNDYLVDNGILRMEKEKSRFANRTLYKLHSVIHKNKTINFFLEKDESLDKVLNIFIRVNSGGTILSYSDLLLSIATAQWKEKDARKEITNFVDEINKIGDGFNFNKDFILKSCLVLSGFKEIAFKVDNFNQNNMRIIELNWENISKSIKTAVLLISSLGYHRDNLTSNNAIIPIAYYLMKRNNPKNFIESTQYLSERRKIFNFLSTVLLKRIFSGQPDNVLRPIRDIIDNSKEVFPLTEIVEKFRGTNKAINFNEDEIDNLFYYQYGQSYSYSSLALLYPNLDYKNKFHLDHIFPKSKFTEKKLLKLGINSEKINFYLENYNSLANLQLLEGIPNQEKSDKNFNEWLNETYPDENNRKNFMGKNYIPNVELTIENFEEFITLRKQLMKTAFSNLVIK